MAEQAHLVFRLGGYSFALDLRNVVKIHDLAAGTEVLTWGDEVNLARYFGVEEEARRPFFRACKSKKKQAKKVAFVEKLTKMGKIHSLNTINEDKIR